MSVSCVICLHGVAQPCVFPLDEPCHKGEVTHELFHVWNLVRLSSVGHRLHSFSKYQDETSPDFVLEYATSPHKKTAASGERKVTLERSRRVNKSFQGVSIRQALFGSETTGRGPKGNFQQDFFRNP